MKSLSKKKLPGRLSLVFGVIYFVLIAFLTNNYAAETRDLSVTAIDQESGQKKEVRLYQKSYAVIIGIDQYKNLPYDKQLSYAVQDASGVAETLKKHFKFDKIITLYNAQATKAEIIRILSGEFSQLGKEDSLFVFWAGHGYTQKTDFGDLGYLIPHDGTFNEPEIYNNISMTMIKDDISKRIPAKHIFFVIDACYSGLLLEKRGADRLAKRDLSYLMEITKEKVRQVLTAGSDDQEVLDGGPKGHSVFTGRFIEILENTDDFITGTEVATLVKEKVFSDAKARGHIQTPLSGQLYGIGDYVFIPSLEQKVEDAQLLIGKYQEELKSLEAKEKEAARTQDETIRRLAELDKKAIEAKLKAEQLRQERLEAEKKKREQEEAERLRKEQELAQEKKEAESRLAVLKKDVETKRATLGDDALYALSPAAAIKEMQEIDAKIGKIKEDYRKELADAINMISKQINYKFEKVVQAQKDEFETEKEFEEKKERLKKEAEQEQAKGFIEESKKIEDAYNKEVAPFIEALKKLSGQEYTITAQDLSLQLGEYDPKFNTYPVTITSKEPYGGVKVACSANIPIPRDDAKVFKQHFENNILRPEVGGNFQSKEFFRVAKAYVIDDATNKQYDFFASKFVDLGNGIVYDSVTNLLWLKDAYCKDAYCFKKTLSWEYTNIACKNLAVAGLKGWRLPKKNELKRMVTVYNYQEPHPFNNINEVFWVSDLCNDGYNMMVDLSNGKHYCRGDLDKFNVWPVRGEGIIPDGLVVPMPTLQHGKINKAGEEIIPKKDKKRIPLTTKELWKRAGGR